MEQVALICIQCTWTLSKALHLALIQSMPRHIPPGAAPITLRALLYAFRGIYNQGSYVKKIQHELSEYFAQKFCFPVSSGRAALTLILQAMQDLHPGRTEVIIPAYTCYSVPAAVVKAGCKPVLCDIALDTLDLNLKHLKDKISSKTLAVIPCNLFGILSDIETIKDCIKSEPIFIIDDAAQAMGEQKAGKFAGTRGDVGIFSLDRGKNITTVQGGVILTNNKNIANRLTKLTESLSPCSLYEQLVVLLKALAISFFLSPNRYWLLADIPFLGLGKTVYSTNFTPKLFSGVQAGLACDWQKRLERFNNVRQLNARYYSKKIHSNSQKTREVIHIPHEASPHRYPYLLPEGISKNEVVTKCAKLGVGAAYPGVIADIPELELLTTRDEFKHARTAAERLITLPTHPYICKQDMENLYVVIGHISTAFSGS